MTEITNRVTDFDEETEEIIWIEKSITNVKKLYIGTYYGKQEKAPVEEVETEFSNLSTQIRYFKTKGEVILIRDFNGKLHIEKQIRFYKNRLDMENYYKT